MNFHFFFHYKVDSIVFKFGIAWLIVLQKVFQVRTSGKLDRF